MRNFGSVLCLLTALAVLLCAALVIPEVGAQDVGAGKRLGRDAPDVTRQPAPLPAHDAEPTRPPPAAGAQQPPARASDRPAVNSEFDAGGGQRDSSSDQMQASSRLDPSDSGRSRAGRQFDASGRWLGAISALARALGIAALPTAQLLASALMIGLGVLAAMLLWIAMRGSRVSLPLARRVEPALDLAQTAKLRTSGVAGAAAVRPIPRPVPARATVLRPQGVPPEFDVEAFVRIAKVQFLRLQSAWDAKDLTSISQFTTPEIFANIRTQLEGEAETSNHTRVVELEAELLGFRERAEDWLASVRFDGMIRERPGTPAEPFQEVWNLSKRKQRNAVWLLAGIQPLH